MFLLLVMKDSPADELLFVLKAMHVSEKSLVCNMQCKYCILPRILVLQICAILFHERVNTMQRFEETMVIHKFNLKRMYTYK